MYFPRLALAALFPLLLFACNRPAQETETLPPLRVTVLHAAPADWVTTLRLPGTLVAREEVPVSTALQGQRILSVTVDVGDRVQAGQVLALFDTATLKQELAQAQAQEARAQAALAQAKRNAARAGKLVQERAVSVSDSEQLASAVREGQAALNGAVAARKLAQLRLGYAEVRAPVAGVVVSRPAQVGMTAGIGSPLFVLQVDGALEWQAQVSPEDGQRLKVGTPARVTVGAAEVGGRVRLFVPDADAQSRRVVVRVALDSHADLRANLLLRGRFLLGKEEVWTIPAAALVREDGHDFVVLVEADNRVRRQALTLGERLGDRVVVLDGLPQGARFVLRGGSFLQDGDVVRVVDGAPAAAGGG